MNKNIPTINITSLDLEGFRCAMIYISIIIQMYQNGIWMYQNSIPT